MDPVVCLPSLAPGREPQGPRKRKFVIEDPSDVVYLGETVRIEKDGSEPAVVDLTSPKEEIDDKKEAKSETPYTERPLKRRLRPRKKPEAVATQPQPPRNVRKDTKTTSKKKVTPTNAPTKKVSPCNKPAEPKSSAQVPAPIVKEETTEKSRQNASLPIEIADSEEDDASL